ncbi:hypothetical protein ACFOVU_04010 [Nocardiopsis sediminis]|uniref:Uncharacterized protein n=1 Tax=Nocardiopsis sediminis TaxID=1778267 RepID=A0ABV8FG06_9ACTN
MAWIAASGVCEGEVVVVESFRDPRRGRVPSPAAPLVAAHARGRGRDVRVGGLDMHPDRETGEATVCAASYLDPESGLPVGIAIGARSDDDRGIAIARDVTESWMAVMRTRRLTLFDGAPRRCRGRFEESDVVLVVGGESGAPSGAGHAETPQAEVHTVDERMVVRPEWLAGRTRIGMALGEHAHAGLTEELITTLAGVGPLTVEDRRSRSIGAKTPGTPFGRVARTAAHRSLAGSRHSSVARASRYCPEV